MGSFGLETVVVGDVPNRIHDAIWAGVRERTLDGNGFVLASGVDQFPALLLADAVAGLHAER